MSTSAARGLIFCSASLAVAIAVYSAWNLMWALAGLDAFARELGQPRPEEPAQLTTREAWSMLEGFAAWRLNQLSVAVPISALCLAALHGYVASRLRTPGTKEASK